MKCKVLVLTILIALILACYSFAASAACVPDGFAGVLWGAGLQQVDQAMAAQGFSVKGQYPANGDGHSMIAYTGQLEGITGVLSFYFLNGTFYTGQFSIRSNDSDSAQDRAYEKFCSSIQSKYGTPTTLGDNRINSSTLWDGLQDPVSLDIIQIGISRIIVIKPYGVLFEVWYTNQSLQQRLAR